MVAALLHYLFLAVFCWMLCEGVMLYLMLVVVFSRLSKKWWFFLLLGWRKCVLIYCNFFKYAVHLVRCHRFVWWGSRCYLHCISVTFDFNYNCLVLILFNYEVLVKVQRKGLTTIIIHIVVIICFLDLIFLQCVLYKVHINLLVCAL